MELSCYDDTNFVVLIGYFHNQSIFFFGCFILNVGCLHSEYLLSFVHGQHSTAVLNT
jgi:hypothetical protein